MMWKGFWSPMNLKMENAFRKFPVGFRIGRRNSWLSSPRVEKELGQTIEIVNIFITTDFFQSLRSIQLNSNQCLFWWSIRWSAVKISNVPFDLLKTLKASSFDGLQRKIFRRVMTFPMINCCRNDSREMIFNFTLSNLVNSPGFKI